MVSRPITVRAPRARARGHAVLAQQPQALHHHRIADADLRLLSYRDHRSDATVQRRGFLIGQLGRQAHHTGPRQQVAVLGKATQQVRRLVGRIVPVLAEPHALLGHVQDAAVVARTAEEELGPGHAVALAERFPAHIGADRPAQLLYRADDLVAENAGRRIVPLALPGVDVRPTDRGHRDAHQGLVGLDGTQRILLHREGPVWPDEHGCACGATHGVITPYGFVYHRDQRGSNSVSNTSWLCRWLHRIGKSGPRRSCFPNSGLGSSEWTKNRRQVRPWPSGVLGPVVEQLPRQL